MYYKKRKQNKEDKRSSRAENKGKSTIGALQYIQTTPDSMESLNLDLSMQTQVYQ